MSTDILLCSLTPFPCDYAHVVSFNHEQKKGRGSYTCKSIAFAREYAMKTSEIRFVKG